MDFGFHPKFVSLIEKEAAELCLLLVPPKPTGERKVVISDNSRFSVKLSDADINLSQHSTLDPLGNTKARYFNSENGSIGFDENTYLGFDNLVERVYKIPSVSRILSRNYLEDTLFKWFEERYKNIISLTLSILDYLRQQAQTEIRERKISIPISFMSIDSSFQVGKVRFGFYGHEFFDELENHWLTNSRSEKEAVLNQVTHLRKKYQGVAFASINCCVETQKAIEIARTETEKSLMILRFFSISVFVPEAPSYFGIMGRTNVPTSHAFIFEDKIPEIRSTADEPRQFEFKVSNDVLETMKRIGLVEASDLISTDNFSPLEKMLLTSISFFSKAIGTQNYQDKLVFLLVAAENLLILTTSEPIQHSIGLRLCFLCADTVEKRKKAIKIVKDAYRLRSNYLHHGKSKMDFRLLGNLQLIIWSSIRNILLKRQSLKTQDELINYLEEKILGG